MTRGVRAVTMDDIAGELGISKKTLYQHFPDKDTLIHETLRYRIETECTKVEGIHTQGLEFLQRLLLLSQHMQNSMLNVNPHVIDEIRKYHPNAWLLFQNFQQREMRDWIKRDLQEGIREGVFRDDIPLEILTDLRLKTVELGFDIQAMSHEPLSLGHIQRVLLDHYLRGLMTLRGLEQYQQLQSQYTT